MSPRKTKPADSYTIKKKVKRSGRSRKSRVVKVTYTRPKGSLPLKIRNKSERS